MIASRKKKEPSVRDSQPCNAATVPVSVIEVTEKEKANVIRFVTVESPAGIPAALDLVAP